jgi:methionyl-tRNA synthetase
MTPLQWADRNANIFKETFKKLGIENNDFIRTTEKRHKDKVQQYISELQKTGDVYEGEYEGWYDAGQEEYIPDTKAEEYNFISPINKKPLVRKKEKNYFFKLSAYQERLRKLLEGGTVDGQTFTVLPEARRNEVLGRINEGLNDVPISRSGTGGWGIPIPNDPDQAVYVWIDALFNYLSVVDNDKLKKYWPADAHLIAKDILWFHAVIWPAMLLALQRPLPKVVYSHSFWMSEGQKMSKSLGNFIDLEKIDYYVEKYSLDALRWFLATSGPWDVNDSDFAESKFIDVYNRDLANDFGNLLNRVSGLIGKHFEGIVPPRPVNENVPEIETLKTFSPSVKIKNFNLSDALRTIMGEIGITNQYIEKSAPWKLMKEGKKKEAGDVLYIATERLRFCTVLLKPVMPKKTKVILDVLDAIDSEPKWGELKPGTKLKSHEALFPRIETKR